MLRFGIVGFGLHAKKRLAPGFAAARQAKIAAVFRRDLNQARASAREHGIPLAFASVEELCRSPEVDAVFVATPNACHAPNVLSAIEAGKAVLCEKPMAMNAGEARRMVEAAGAAGVLLGVAQVLRFTNTVQRFRQRVAAGEVGAPVVARAEFAYPGLTHPRTWIHRRSLGGGVMADVGVHCIDCLRYILQDEVIAIQAQAAGDAHSGDVECAGVMLLRFSRGTLGSVMVNMRSEYRTPIEITGDRASLTADNALSLEEPVVLQRRHGNRILDAETLFNRNAFPAMIDSFALAWQNKTQFPVSGEEGLRNQLLVDAAYESARTGRLVSISP